MTLLERRLRRRQLLRAGAAATSLLLLPRRAPAQGGAKALSGITLNIACWSSPCAKLLTDYVPQFEEATGAKVNYETPSFPIYNQRIDVELSTGGSSYDVLNVTFIYIGRWIGAGWFVPLDPYLTDLQKTPADWEADDFLPGATAAFRDASGKLYAIPWTADIYMAGAARYDLFENAGKAMPDTFGGVAEVMKAVHMKDGIPAFLPENHYGWSLYSVVAGLWRQRVPRSARGFDAGARYAGGHRRGRFFCQAAP
jgi:multiple sugar transport system substrate-binding protein